MKASELIEKLQIAIKERGDLEVEKLGSYRYEPLCSIIYNKEEGKEKIANPHANTFIIC